MGQRGTFGYIKDGEYYSWLMQSGEYWNSDNIIEIIKMDFSKFYKWIKQHGEDRFIELINAEPDGYQYPEFRLKAGTLSGDKEVWEGGDGELERRFSPYANVWLDTDEKTINIRTKDAVEMNMSYVNNDQKVGQRLFLKDIFTSYDEVDLTWKQIKNARFDSVDYYVFFCVYDHIREIL